MKDCMLYMEKEIYNMSRIVYLVAKENVGLDENVLIIPLDVERKNVPIEELVALATKEFLSTEEGEKALEETCGNFNYADFDTYVPNSICGKYGFWKVPKCYDENILVDLNASLL